MKLKTKTKEIELPAFFPDATHGVIKSLDTVDIISAKADGLVVNAYHFLVDTNVDILEKIGGIHKFMEYDGPVISDSGGFQAMSLVRNRKNGKMTNDGILFKNPESGSSIMLTPEYCIETQSKIGSDIIMCLDDCTDPEEKLYEQQKSVERTLEWAKRCKKTYDGLFKNKKVKPLIFGIIQGGNDKGLRKKCAEGLNEIGFDGFAYGGWPVNKGNFMHEIVEYTASLMPDDKPKYAMGVGKPEDVVACTSYSYNLFDCVLPTRDARHKRLYRFTEKEPDLRDKGFYEYLRISSSTYEKTEERISDNCDCHTCTNFSLGYLSHLFKVKEQTAFRLATIHNIRFYSMLMEMLRSI